VPTALNPRSRSVATLDAIVAATRKLLARKDYASLSMRAVAREAGITPGAIYKHFANKRALVDHVARRTLEDFQDEMLEAAAAHRPGSFDRVIAQGNAYLRLAREKPEHFKILFTPTTPEPTRLRDLPGQGLYHHLRRSIVEAMDAGELRRADPDLVTFFLWSRVHGIATLLMACDFEGCLPRKPEDITAKLLFEESRDLLWEGLKP
jgi:AcrR family transcriptional regulator